MDTIVKNYDAKFMAAQLKADGVSDLKARFGLACAGAFARALALEAFAGHTTPEAEVALETAILAEAKGLSEGK